MEQAYIKQVASMKRPIPGMSLTNDPESPAPFEGPPEFTKKKEALEAIFEGLIEEDVYMQLIESLASGVPVTSVAQVLLYQGFREGKWNPDLFLLLIEPTIYMVMALAERAGVDYEIDYDTDNEEERKVTEMKNRFDSISKKVSKGKVGMLPKELEKQIEELPIESLLAKPKGSDEPVVEPEQESLITRPR
jgi:hypothetical protein